jgi:hypothetical protein
MTRRRMTRILAGAALLALSFPAHAQYGAPFGSPGMMTTPEFTNGAIGAGAASNTANQAFCGSSGVARDGQRNQCEPSEPPQPPRGRR